MMQHLLPTVPMLAPLIDGMVTRNVARRFTAAQALEFFEELCLQISQEQLSFNPGWHAAGQPFVYDDIRADRWRNLPDEFVRAWSHLREPKVPMKTRLLCRICRNVWCRRTVMLIRHFCRLIRNFSGFFGGTDIGYSSRS